MSANLPMIRRRAARATHVTPCLTRRELDTVSMLIYALEHFDTPRGTTVLCLAARTGVAPVELRRALCRHSDYFVAVGQQHFRLNPFGRFRGDARAMRAHAEAGYRRQRLALLGVVAAVVLGVLMQLVALVG